jgi:hypothetical protein
VRGTGDGELDIVPQADHLGELCAAAQTVRSPLFLGVTLEDTELATQIATLAVDASGLKNHAVEEAPATQSLRLRRKTCNERWSLARSPAMEAFLAQEAAGRPRQIAHAAEARLLHSLRCWTRTGQREIIEVALACAPQGAIGRGGAELADI